MQWCLLLLSILPTQVEPAEGELERLSYNHTGLQVDLGVGLWAHPLPMDYDSDGDLDLVVVTPDVPSNGTYFFENPDGSAYPVFRPGKKIAPGIRNPVISYAEGTPRVTTPGKLYPDHAALLDNAS